MVLSVSNIIILSRTVWNVNANRRKIVKLLLTTQNVTNNKIHSFIIMVKGMKGFIVDNET